jgi:hypothetical protein
MPSEADGSLSFRLTHLQKLYTQVSSTALVYLEKLECGWEEVPDMCQDEPRLG